MGATSHEVHIDQALSEMALGYRPEGMIADMIFPIVNVAKQSDKYVEWSRADRLRSEDDKRAPATEAKIIEESVSSGTYWCSNYALKTRVPIEDLKNADPIYLDGLTNGKVNLVQDKLFLNWDIRVSNLCTSGSNVGSYAACGSEWNDGGAGSDPLGDLNTALDNVQFSTGVKPNRIVFGLRAWTTFRRHPDVTNKIYGTNNGGGYATVQQVANLFEVEQVLVGGAFQNTAGEGLSESLSAVWDDHVLVYYAPMSPSKERPSFGYSFRWNQPGLPNFQVERHPYDSKIKAQEVEVGYYQDEKLTGATYGFLFTNVTSST